MSGYQPVPTEEEQQQTVLLQQQQQQQQQQFPPTYVYPPVPGAQELQNFPPPGQQIKLPSPPEYNLYNSPPPPGTQYLVYSPPHETVQPEQHDPERIKEYLLAREYSLDVGRYIKESWAKYKECWWGFTGIFVLFALVSQIPYVGGLLAWPLMYGFFLAGAHSVRNGTPVQYPHLFNGYFFYGPLFVIQLLYGLAVAVGFVLLIIPGVWAFVALSFAAPLFLEYRGTGLKMMDCLKISYKVVNKNFCNVFGYMFIIAVFALSGILLLGVGALVTFPIAYISLVYAFDDMFGLNRSSNQLATECVQC